MDYDVALLIFGILLLLVGLVGSVKAKELEIGTSNPTTRVVVGTVGIGLIALSLLLSPAWDRLEGWVFDDDGTEPVSPDTRTSAETEERGQVEEPPVGPTLDARVAVVSVSDSLGEVTAEALANSVAALEVVPHDALQRLGVFDPGLILVAADTGGVWPEMSPTILGRVFNGKKILGLGTGGAELYQALGASIGRGSAMHARGQHDIVLSNFPSGHVQRPDLPPRFPVHLPGRSDVLGIHDGGSPALRGFEAFAHWPARDHHWPVVRQGNLLLWGFDAPLDTLTAEGRTLLVALMQDHLDRPFVSFEERLPDIKTVPPGTRADRLTEEFRSHTRHIRLAQAGVVRAVVHFERALGPLALVLNGPGQVGYYDRKDGDSPLELVFEVTPELLERGDVWRVTVTKFGAVPRPIDYEIELEFPD